MHFGPRRLTLRQLIDHKRNELRRKGWPDQDFDFAALRTSAARAELSARVLAEVADGTSENVMAGVVGVSRTHVARCVVCRVAGIVFVSCVLVCVCVYAYGVFVYVCVSVCGCELYADRCITHQVAAAARSGACGSGGG